MVELGRLRNEILEWQEILDSLEDVVKKRQIELPKLMDRSECPQDIYYDGGIQSLLQDLVNFVRSVLYRGHHSGARNPQRAWSRPQAASSNVLSFRRAVSVAYGKDEDDAFVLSRIENPKEDNYDKLVNTLEETAKIGEAVADAFLRGGNCSVQVKKVKACLTDVMELAKDFVQAEPEEAQILKGIKEINLTQHLVTKSPGWPERLPDVRKASAVLEERYVVGRRIGEGTFGVVYEGIEKSSQRQVAFKFERRSTETPQLRNEFRRYKRLDGCDGIPTAHELGQEHLHNVLVLDLLGLSLEDLFNRCDRRFTVKTIAMMGMKMVSLLQAIHEEGDFIWCDLKPENFVIGRIGTDTANVIHAIDFGIAKDYRDQKTKKHIPYRVKRSPCGTYRYMSINTHLGCEQSRRDDLEALGYLLLYHLRGRLPWDGFKATTAAEENKIMGKVKKMTSIHDLCMGYPIQFEKYLEYVRDLAFEATPDYDYLQRLFVQMLEERGEVDDGRYDWDGRLDHIPRRLRLVQGQCLGRAGR